jgi:hypothetical protein
MDYFFVQVLLFIGISSFLERRRIKKVLEKEGVLLEEDTSGADSDLISYLKRLRSKFLGVGYASLLLWLGFTVGKLLF